MGLTVFLRNNYTLYHKFVKKEGAYTIFLPNGDLDDSKERKFNAFAKIVWTKVGNVWT